MKEKSFLLGLAANTQDRHKRITRGKNFYILGGSKETHHFLQETCIKFNEELDKRHKNLDQISGKEFYDIAHKTGLRPPEPATRKE